MKTLWGQGAYRWLDKFAERTYNNECLSHTISCKQECVNLPCLKSKQPYWQYSVLYWSCFWLHCCSISRAWRSRPRRRFTLSSRRPAARFRPHALLRPFRLHRPLCLRWSLRGRRLSRLHRSRPTHLRPHTRQPPLSSPLRCRRAARPRSLSLPSRNWESR